MRYLPISPILRWAILTGYALLVALGHGGWHLVVDHGQCGAMGHASHAVGTTTCSHGHAHSCRTHRSCQHGAPQIGRPPKEAPAPAPTPAHDSDHCSVCAVFSAPLTLATVVEVSLTLAEATSDIEWHTEIVSTTQVMFPAPRGPPTCEIRGEQITALVFSSDC